MSHETILYCNERNLPGYKNPVVVCEPLLGSLESLGTGLKSIGNDLNPSKALESIGGTFMKPIENFRSSMEFQFPSLKEESIEGNETD